MLDKLLNRLTDNYNKDPNSNIGKLFQIIACELEEVNKALSDVKLFRDIDKATSKTLDNIGKNVLEYRSTDSDELYRQLIKTKIIANLSQGDIETINKVANVLMRDMFEGVEETWNNPIYDDIAGLSIKIKSGYGEMLKVPNALNRVKAGGVGLHWLSKSIANHNIYYGITNRQLKTNTYYPYSIEDIKITNPLRLGISSRIAKTLNYSINIIEDTKTNNQIFFTGICKRLKEVKMEVEHV